MKKTSLRLHFGVTSVKGNITGADVSKLISRKILLFMLRIVLIIDRGFTLISRISASPRKNFFFNLYTYTTHRVAVGIPAVSAL